MENTQACRIIGNEAKIEACGTIVGYHSQRVG
jgi:hypothetical protein